MKIKLYVLIVIIVIIFVAYYLLAAKGKQGFTPGQPMRNIYLPEGRLGAEGGRSVRPIDNGDLEIVPFDLTRERVGQILTMSAGNENFQVTPIDYIEYDNNLTPV